MAKFISFPKIHQFVDVIRNIKHKSDYRGLQEDGSPLFLHDQKYPTLEYKGTVKIHGTNAAIVYDSEGKYHCQSRENIITPRRDNAGFAAFVYSLPKEVMDLLCSPDYGVFGEWAGGNIQSGVAVNGLPKMFVIFKERPFNIEDYDEQDWIVTIPYDLESLKLLNEYNIYHINQFPTFSINIDFERPEIAQNELVKITEEVERECPVGKFFGKEGVGEGLVWTPVDPEYDNSGYWFKAKGLKHSSSKHKTIVPIDIEVIKAIEDIVSIVVTDSRVDQGINKLKELGKEVSVKNIGDFLKWINSDIESEEKELLDKSGIERKKIHGKISNKAKNMFLDRLTNISRG